MILVLVLVMLRKSPCWRGEPPHVVDPDAGRVDNLVPPHDIRGLDPKAFSDRPRRVPASHRVRHGGAPLTTLLCGVST